MISTQEKKAVEQRFDLMIDEFGSTFSPEDVGSFLAGVLFGGRLERTSRDASSVVLTLLESRLGNEVGMAGETMEVKVREIADHIKGE